PQGGDPHPVDDRHLHLRARPASWWFAGEPSTPEPPAPAWAGKRGSAPNLPRVTATSDPVTTVDEMRRAVDDHPFWYHTIDVAPGVTTKGWFDLRGVVDLMPWPDVRGKRCLDIGTFDGFFAFELERRGAAEVVE